MLCSSVAAQQAKVYHVGVIHQGGPYKAVVDGLRDGLRQLGYEEGKQIVLEIRDTKSDPKLVEEAARNFERESQVDLRRNHVCSHSGQECYLVYPDCFLGRQRPGRQRTGAELWETRGETYGCSVLDHGSHGKAARDPKGNLPKLIEW